MLRASLPLSCALALIGPPAAAQAPCFEADVGLDLDLTDDDTAQGLALGFTFTFNGVPYTDVCVCSNGYVWLGPTSPRGGDFTPTEAELLFGAPRICPLWNDFSPKDPGSGHIYFNSFPATGTNPAFAIMSWVDVFEYGTGNPVSFQLRLAADNSITVTYGANTPFGGALNQSMIIGASPGNGATPNPITFVGRPLTVTQNTFDEVLPTRGGFFPYASVSMLWSRRATGPGYTIADRPCTPNSFPSQAVFERLGGGCPTPPTVYEFFDTVANPLDLSNQSFAFLPNGTGGYVMLQGVAGPWFSGFTNNLGAGDDTTHTVSLPFPFTFAGASTTSITVSSNGFLYLVPGQGDSGCCSGDVFTLLTGDPRIAGVWMDLFPPGGGGVFADFDAATGEFVVTWDNLFEFASQSTTCTFQIALKPSGAFDLRYHGVGIDPFVGHQAIAGFSGGVNAVDPGSRDLSATVTLDTGPAGLPLDLDALGDARPQLGSVQPLLVSRIPTTSALSLFLIGTREALPPINLAFLGAPSCASFIDFVNGAVVSQTALTGGNTVVNFNLGIPSSVRFAGAQLIGQAVANDPAVNALGLRFSNAVRMTLGL